MVSFFADLSFVVVVRPFSVLSFLGAPVVAPFVVRVAVLDGSPGVLLSLVRGVEAVWPRSSGSLVFFCVKSWFVVKYINIFLSYLCIS
jgi:hypothetical protein